MMSLMSSFLIALAVSGEGRPAVEERWSFDPNTLRLTGPDLIGVLRPVGDMHGVIIEKMGDVESPVAGGRAFLNLEHYLEKGRWAEYLPRRLDHTVTMSRRHLTIHFPEPPEWPVVSELTYTFDTPGAIDARLDFQFTGEMEQFEVYFTSYFAPQYERSIRVGGEWVRPEISPHEQLLIPRDDRIAARYEDGRWNFLQGRTRLADERFEIPVMVSTDDETGWMVVQMIEPGACTHIAPNRFAVGHNFIIGGWDVKKGDRRSARIRLVYGKGLTPDAIEEAYRRFADFCRQQQGEGSD